MKPTAKLRFVEREIEIHGDLKPVRILQQWWEDSNVMLAVLRFSHAGHPDPMMHGEWRDVPLEAE